MKKVKITQFNHLTNGIPIIVILPHEKETNLSKLLEIYIKDQLDKFIIEIKNQNPPILQKLKKKKEKLEELKRDTLNFIKKIGFRVDKEKLSGEKLTVFFENSKKGSVEYTILKSKEELQSLIGKYKNVYFIKNNDMLHLAKQSVDNLKMKLQEFNTTSKKIENLIEVLALKKTLETLSNLVPVKFKKHGIIIDISDLNKAIILETFLQEKISKKANKDRQFYL